MHGSYGFILPEPELFGGCLKPKHHHVKGKSSQRTRSSWDLHKSIVSLAFVLHVLSFAIISKWLCKEEGEWLFFNHIQKLIDHLNVFASARYQHKNKNTLKKWCRLPSYSSCTPGILLGPIRNNFGNHPKSPRGLLALGGYLPKNQRLDPPTKKGVNDSVLASASFGSPVPTSFEVPWFLGLYCQYIICQFFR